jgi:prepilin-type N-terminal cleavage/methylation domain-containing protein
MKIVRADRGYTLIEVLIVIAILGVIMGPMAMAVNSMFQNFRIGRDTSLALRQVQNAGYWVTNDIKRAKTVDTTVPNVFLRLQCYYWDEGTQTMLDNQQVDYVFNSGTLRRTIGSTTMQVAEFIDQLNTTILLDEVTATYTITVKSVFGNSQETRQYHAIQRVSG